MKGKQEIAVIQQFGQRIREARQLGKLTIQKASVQLGINAAALNRLENGIIDASTPINLKFVKDAAEVFDVTADFLLGLAGDEWERDPSVLFQRNIGAGMQQATGKRLVEIAAKLQQQDRQIAAISGTTTKTLKAVSDLNNAIEKFIELNHSFNNLPGSATLLNRAKIAAKATQEAQCQLVRCKIILLRGINETSAKGQRQV